MSGHKRSQLDQGAVVDLGQGPTTHRAVFWCWPLGKTILCARLEPLPDTNITSEWQRCDLFPDHGRADEIDIADGGQPVVLDTWACSGCWTLCASWGSGRSTSRSRRWVIRTVPRYRGWAPLEEIDAAVFFGRDAQILGGLDVLHGMRTSGVKSLFVVRHPWPVRGGEVVVSAGRVVAPAAPRRPPLPAAADRAPRTRGAHRRTRPRPGRPPVAHGAGLAPAGAGGDQDRLPPRPCGAAARLAGGGRARNS